MELRTTHQQRVRQFMQNAGQDTPESPIIPDGDTRELRASLMLEEVLETIAGMGVEVLIRHDGAASMHVEKGACEFHATGEVDMVEVADRLRSFQAGPLACKENACALTHIEEAMHWLQQRTIARMRRGVEDTHEQ